MKKIKTLSSALVFAAIIVISIVSVHAQQTEPSWEDMMHRVDERADKVKALKAYFRIDTFTPASVRARARAKAVEDVAQRIKPHPSDSNASEGFFWVADRVRWRCEKTTFYPETEDDYNLSVFDGEKHTVYNAYKRIATIDSIGDKSDPFMFQQIESNPFLSIFRLESYEQVVKKKKTSFYFDKKENVNGFDCLKYSATDGIYSVSLWICPVQQDVVIKISEGWRDSKGNGVRSETIVTAVSQQQNIVVPSQAERDFYDMNNGKFEWSQTRRFSLSNIEFPEKLSDENFRDVLRVGMPLVNNLEAPGRVDIVGGNPEKSIEQVKQGILSLPELKY